MRRIFLLLQDADVIRQLLPALLSGASLGIFIHGYWFVDFYPDGSKWILLLTVLTSLIGVVGYTLLFRQVKEGFSGFSILQKVEMVGVSLLAGAFLLFAVTTQWQEPHRYARLFLPTHTLEISIPPEQDTDQVSILWFNTSLGDVSYGTIEHDGWELQGDRLTLVDFSKNHLRWMGKTGEDVQIVFESPSQSGTAVVAWDGQGETLQFSRKKNSYVHTFSVPFYASRGFLLLLGLLNATLLSLPLCLWVWGKRDELLRSIQRDSVLASQQVHTREWLVILGSIVLALALRIPNLEILFPTVEEYSHINAAKQIIQGVPISDVYQRGMWLVTFPVSLMFRVFGYKLWVARLLGVIFNALAVIPLYFVARKINRPIALLSVLLFATSPWMIAISRVVREYAYTPFYYLWIVYGIMLLLEEIPNGFHLDEHWRIVLRPKVLLLLGLSLVLPSIYALSVDFLSTFKLILIAYPILGFFIFLKLDARHGKNISLLLVMMGVGAVSAYFLRWHFFSIHPTVNQTPLGYFFLNSPQQWYFNRVALLPLLGVFGAVLFSVLMWRMNKNAAPLFLLMLYAGFLGLFVFTTTRFFAPRHLSTTQLWYIVLMAIGLYLFWIFLQNFSWLRERRNQTLAVIIFVGLTFNIQQSFLPVTSRASLMPITEDYHNDLTELQAFMLANVNQNDVLISSRIYSRYVTWVDEPKFQKVYDFQVQTTENDVLSIVEQYDSGWIIIDNARIERSVFSPEEVFQADDRIQYVGLFDDEHVWRWRVK